MPETIQNKEILIKLLRDTGLELVHVDGITRLQKTCNINSNLGMTPEFALVQQIWKVLK